MDWVKEHYTRQSRLIGRSDIWPGQIPLAEALATYFDEQGGRKRILELGAGACGLAAALSKHGYETVAVEFNPNDIRLARDLLKKYEVRGVEVIEADFYEAQLDERFDIILYWDGFGVGADADQRRLLRRVGSDWLTDEGYALIDVFSPWNWSKNAGQVSEMTANDGSRWTRRLEFDAVNGRLIDFVQPKDADVTPPEGVGSAPLSQSIRTYSMPEFEMLTEGTGTRVAAFHDDLDARVEMGRFVPEVSDEVRRSNGYYVKLVKDD